ncbi:MAG: NYN domain-containing protein [Alistipes onderdonkii]
MELSDKKFAVLIDADNISHRKIKDILDEIANYGTPTIKRIYGDFTDPVRGMEKRAARIRSPDPAIRLRQARTRRIRR